MRGASLLDVGVGANAMIYLRHDGTIQQCIICFGQSAELADGHKDHFQRACKKTEAANAVSRGYNTVIHRGQITVTFCRMTYTWEEDVHLLGLIGRFD